MKPFNAATPAPSRGDSDAATSQLRVVRLNTWTRPEGASLTEIGQTLRHVRPLTTALYAKVDLDGLRGLARPWPGEPS